MNFEIDLEFINCFSCHKIDTRKLDKIKELSIYSNIVTSVFKR